MNKFVYTRKMYLDGKCSHHDYYSQFVTAETISRLLENISRKRIEMSEDDAFNDIPLHTWDNAVLHPKEINRALYAKFEIASKAGKVCILKAAARQVKEQNGEAFVKWAVNQLK